MNPGVRSQSRPRRPRKSRVDPGPGQAETALVQVPHNLTTLYPRQLRSTSVIPPENKADRHSQTRADARAPSPLFCTRTGTSAPSSPPPPLDTFPDSDHSFDSTHPRHSFHLLSAQPRRPLTPAPPPPCFAPPAPDFAHDALQQGVRRPLRPRFVHQRPGTHLQASDKPQGAARYLGRTPKRAPAKDELDGRR